jgi:predicted Zn-dependent protease
MGKPKILRKLAERNLFARQKRNLASLEALDRKTQAMRDAQARARFFEVLQVMRGRAAKQFLLRMLKDPRYASIERKRAVTIYASNYPRSALPLYRKLLLIADLPACVRAQMALELTRGRPYYNATVLRRVLANPKDSLTVRIACAKALATWRSPRSRRLLSQIVRNPNENPRLRKAAAQSLAELNKMKWKLIPRKHK